MPLFRPRFTFGGQPNPITEAIPPIKISLRSAPAADDDASDEEVTWEKNSTWAENIIEDSDTDNSRQAAAETSNGM